MSSSYTQSWLTNIDPTRTTVYTILPSPAPAANCGWLSCYDALRTSRPRVTRRRPCEALSLILASFPMRLCGHHLVGKPTTRFLCAGVVTLQATDALPVTHFALSRTTSSSLVPGPTTFLSCSGFDSARVEPLRPGFGPKLLG